MSKNCTYSLWKSLLGLVFLLGMAVEGYGQGGITYTIVPAQCNGTATGSITVLLDQNNDCSPGPYQYQLVGPYTGSPNAGTTVTTLPATPTTSLTQQFLGLSSGTYNINILINGNYCTGVDGAFVSQPTLLTSTVAVSQPLCNQLNTLSNNYLGSATITVNGGSTGTCINNCKGYNISWTGPASSSGGSLNGCPKEIVTCAQGALTNTYLMNNLVAGTYIISIEDNNNCPLSTSFTIAQPPAISPTISPVNIPCNGGSGSIGISNLNASDGTPASTGFNISWAGSSTGDPVGAEITPPNYSPYSISPLGIGTYSLTITDANGCAFNQGNIQITQPVPLSVTSSTIPALCYNQASGSVTFTVSGGNPGYSISWTGSNGSGSSPNAINSSGGTATINNLLAGNYVFTFTDNGGGCTTTANVTISQPPAALSVSTTIQNILCFGANNGSILVHGTGGTPQGNTPSDGYHVTWSGQSSGPPGALTAAIEIPTANPSIISGNYPIGSLAPGNYSITLTDKNGCTSNQNVTITEPPQLFLSETHINNTCFNGTNGSVNLTVVGGTPFTGTPPYYNYSWTSSCGFVSNVQDPINIPGACTLAVAVTDANACTVNFPNIVITAPPALNLTGVVTQIQCAGINSGAIDITNSGGTPGYSYLWSGPSGFSSSSADLTNLAPGTYNLTVTDANGCTITGIWTINPAPPALVMNLTPTHPLCYNGTNGSILVTVNGGTPNYTLTGALPLTTQTITPTGAGTNTYLYSSLGSGSYTITVTDANGCTQTQTQVLNNPAQLSVTATTTPPSCNGGSNGTITIVATGGTGTLTYSTVPATSTTANITGVTAGTYQVVVVDGNGCQATVNVVVSEPAPLVITETVTQISCNGADDGGISIVPSGGTPGYTYSWVSSPPGVIPSSGSISNLVPGTYTVTVTDATNQCTATETYTITEPPVLDLQALITDAINCFGQTGEITATVTGGTANYTLSGIGGNQALTAVAPSHLYTGLTAGTYTITVTDSKGCTDVQTVVLTQPNLLTLSATTTGILCSGQTASVTLTPSGGTPAYTYTGSATTGLVPGTYNYTVTDANSCTANTSITITQPSALVVTAVVGTPIACSGGQGTVIVSATGGTPAYSGTGTFTVSAGTHTFTVTDNNGCTNTATITVTQPAPLVATASIVTPILCNGGQGVIEVIASGGTASYTGTGNFNVSAGTHTYPISDANGCQAQDVITINQPTPIVVTAVLTTPILCNGGTGSVTVSASGGTPSYASGIGVFPVTEGANQVFTVVDANGCTGSAQLTITQPTLLTATAVIDAPIQCNGGTTTVTVAASGGTPNYSGTGTFTVSAGSYSFTVTDANGCQVTVSGTVVQPSLLAVSATPQQITCTGLSNGSIAPTVTGGTPAYTYSWVASGGGVLNLSPTLLTQTGLVPGDYELTVTDGSGCEIVETWIINPAPPALVMNLTPTHPLCYNGTNGSILVTVNGGTPNYTLTGALPLTTQTITPTGAGTNTYLYSSLGSGSYTITVTDANGCTQTQTQVLNNPAQLSVTATTTPPSCNGGSNGTITIVATGGTGTLTYSTVPATSTTANITGVTAGTYQVVVVDGNGCQATVNVVVSEPAPLVITETVTQISCNGADDGGISIVPSGGTPGYTYSWVSSPPGVIPSSGSISNLVPGTYTVTVTDATNQCTATETYTITEPPVLDLQALITDAINCFGQTGEITATVTGGTANYTLSGIGGNQALTAVAPSHLYTGLTAGTYTITVTDSKGCTDVQTVVLTQPNLLTLSATTTGILCSGQTASVTLTPSGGTPAYTYTGSATTGLVPGTYNYTVTDANSCTANTSITITQPSALVVTAVVGTPIACSGGQGTVIVSATGGTPAYSGTGTFTVSAGTHTFTVTDNNGCTNTATITVTQPAPLVATASIVTPILCNGGQGVIEVIASGGTASYTGTGNFNVSAGTHTYPISDANGCQAQDVITINQPTPIVVTAVLTTPILCNGGTGSVTVSASGGTPSYASGIGVFPVTEGANQVFTVVDANGCTGSAQLTITQPTLLTATAVIDAPIQCNGGTTTVTVAASGGTPNYSGTGTFTVSAGSYSFTVTDANGCQVTVSGTVVQPSLLAVSATPQQITCTGLSNGSIAPTVTGGTPAYTYSWVASGGGVLNLSPTLLTQTGLVPGDYELTVTDGSGCEIVETWIINPAPPALVMNLTATHPLCYNGTNGSILVTVNGGTPNYTLTGALPLTTQTITPTGAGTNTYLYSSLGSGSYTITVTDANGCTQTQTQVLNNPAQLSVTATTTPPSCNGYSNGTIVLTATGGTGTLTYSTVPATGSGTAVSGTSVTIPNVSAGTYQVVVVDGNGCQATVNVVVSEPALLVITETVTQISCNGANDGGISIVPSGGTPTYGYLWTGNLGGTPITITPNNTANLSNLGPGTYVLVMTDGSSCTATETYTITEPPVLDLQVSITDAINCFGQTGEITAIVTGGTANYTLTGIGVPQTLTAALPTHVYTGLIAGTYTITVTDSKGCTDVQTVVLTQPNLLTLSATTTGILCSGGTASVTLTPSGGTPAYTYTGSATTGLVPGTYNYTVTDANSCTANTSITITQPSALVVTAVVGTPIACSGGQGTVIVSATGGTPIYSGTGTFTVSAGTHTFTVTDQNGCTNTATITVTQPAPLVATASIVAPILCNGGEAIVSVLASGGTPSYTGTGNFNETSGTYTYTISDANGCQAQDVITINQPTPIVVTPVLTAPILCNGGSGQVTVSASGGTPSYASGIGAITVTSGVNQVFTVVDANGCTGSATLTITQPTLLTATAVIDAPIQCNGGTTTVTVAASGGTPNYSGTGTFTVSAGPYSFTVTDANGCTSTVTGTVAQPSLLAVSATPQQITCAGLSNGSISPAVSGGTPGYTFVWTGTDFSGNAISFIDNTLQNQSNLGPGNYSVQITDLNGCILNSPSWSITNPLTSPSIQNVNVQNVNCFGNNTGSISFLATGGTPDYDVLLNTGLQGNIVLSGGTFNIPSLAAGTYTLQIVDNNGCVDTEPITISQPNSAVVAVVNGVNNVSCNGLSDGDILATISGGTAPYSFIWSVVGGVGGPIPAGEIASEDPQGLPDGNYQLLVTDALGCTATVITQVSEPTPINIGWQDSGPLCDGNSLGFINLQLSGGTPNANSPLYNTSWVWAPLQNPGINCSATVIPNNTFNPSSLTCGIYTVTVTDANNCQAQYTDSIIITPTPFQANFTSTNIQCFGQTNGSITVTPTTGTAPFNVVITNGGFSINPAGNEIFTVNNGYTVNNLAAGSYLVTITDNNGCQDVETVIITAPQSPITASISPVDVFCFGGNNGSFSVAILGGTGPFSLNVDPAGVIPAFTASPPSVSGLTANSYSVTVLDVNQCASNPVTVVINQPAAITAIITGTPINCFGDCSAGISAALTGGTLPYTYQWTNGVNSWNTPNINNLCAGNYQFSMTDANGCPYNSSYTITEPPSSLVVNILDTVDVSCYGANDGEIIIAINGGTANYTVTLGGASQTIDPNLDNTATFSNLSPGVYVLTVTDALGCVETINFDVDTPPALTLNVVPTNILCAGQNTGALLITASGGEPSLSYVITGPTPSSGFYPPPANPVTSLAAGPYTVVISDANGCSITVSTNITVPNPIQIVEQVIPVNCHGQSTGQIIPTVTGGAGGYTYSWVASNGGVLSAGASAASQLNIPAGTYTLTVTDVNNCSLQEIYVVTEPQLPLNAVVSSFTNVNCANAANGQITIAISGGTPTYTVNGGAPVIGNTAIFPNLSGGSYSYTVTDINGCQQQLTQLITEPTPLTLGISSTNVLCFGASTGSLEFTTSGGTAPINYNIVGPLNSSGTIPTSSLTTTQVGTPTAGILPAGTYTVNIIDANGCTNTISTTITQPNPIVVTPTVTNILCFGQGAGAISTTTTGGVPPYTYLWSNSAITPNITGVPAGSYTLTVTDANLCTNVQTLAITEPPLALSASLSTPVNISCNGSNNGSVQVTASGGTAGYQVTYQRTTPPGPLVSPAGVEIPLSGGTYPITGLSAGNYTVTVVDDNGCTTNQLFSITEPPAFGATVSANTILCNPGNTGVLTITTPPGSYPVTYVINGPGGLYSGNINTSPFPLNGLHGGTYNISLTYNNGLCSQQLSATINQPANPISVTPSITNVLCAGVNSGSICLNVTGGTGPYTYSWSIPGGTSCQNNLAPGTYTVTVADANNCSVPNTYTISGPVSPLVASSTFTNVLCLGQNDGTITITPNGGSPIYTLTSATLTPASTTINLTGGFYQYTNVAAGTHVVLITDNNGCTDSETITITQPQNPLTATNINVTNVQCYGDMNGGIAFNVSGGTAPYTVSWTATGLPAICSVPASTVSNSGIINETGLCQGTYTVTITDLNNCTYSFAQSIVAPSTPLTASATQTNILCHGQCTGIATTVPSGGTAPYQHSWSNGQTTPFIGGLCVGDYYDTITDANGCEIIVQFSITAPAQPMVVTISDVDVDCFDNATGSITVSATGGTPGYNVSWTPGPPFPVAGLELANSGDSYIIPGLLAGTYAITVEDLNNCPFTQNVIISQPAALTYNVTSTNVTCNGASNGSINLTINGGVLPYSYVWNSTAGSPCSIPVNQANATGLCPGIYDVVVTDANGCQINTGGTITEPTPLLLSVINDTVYCLPGSGTAQAIITGGTPNYTISWQNASGTNIGNGLSISSLAPGVYNATVTDANNCQNTSPFNIIGPAAPLTAQITHTNETCTNNNDGTITIIPSGGTAPFVITGSPWNGSPNVAVSGGNAVSNNMVAGAYTYTITDAYGCQITVSTTITQPTYLQVARQVTNVTCHNANNGIIQITPSGSVPNYTVTWISGPNTGPCALPVTSIISGATSFNNLCPGVYVFSVTDANGCDTTLSATITEPQPLALITTANDDPCNDAICQGSAGVSATGGTAPYTYLWTGGASTSSVGQLCVGVYSVTVTDANGCTQLASVTINQPAQALSALVTTTNETCNGLGNGTLTVSPSGGTAPYSIVGITTPWGGPANINFAGGTSTWTGVSAGTYQVEITDANGCQITVIGTVTEPTPLAVAITPVDVTCYGANNGSVQLGITGATPSYNLTWLSGPNTGPCQLPVNLTVAANAILPNYTSTNLCPGVYDFVVTDANGCDDTLSFTINEPPAIVLAATTIDVLCHGDASGQASITATGGTPGYTYNWVALTGSIPAGQATNQTIGTPTNPNGIPTGTYEVTVTDANGCPSTETVNINQPSTPLVALIDHTDELCFPVPNQASTGTITIGANGGTGHYTIAGVPNNLVWTGPSTIVAQSMLPPNPISGQTMTGVASNLAGAPYSFTVTDFHGCTSTVSVTVGSPAALSVNTTPVNILCNGNNDGAINIAPSGGVAPYNINWISGPTGPGCVLPVTLTTSTNISTPSTMCPGTYVMDIIDANGCVLSTSETILEPANPVNITSSVNDVLCYGDFSGEINTQVSGGTGPYTYAWSTISTWNNVPYAIPFPTNANVGNPTPPFGLPAGTYMVTVTDANGNTGGCYDEAIITITQPATPVAGSLTSHAVDCNSNATGSIDITASGGVGPYAVTRNNNPIGTILLPGGTITETGLIAGNYTYVITDANLCTITLTTIVSQPAPLIVTLNNVVDVSCVPGSFDGAIDLTVVGGNSYYSYNWTTAALPPFPIPLTTPVGGPSVSNLYPGVYTVTVTDLLGCQSTLQVTVNQYPGFTVTSTVGDVPCHGNNSGSINLTLNGGTPNFTFQWTGPNGYNSVFQNINNLYVGQYTVTVTDGAGCVVPLVATVSEPSSALTSTFVSSNVACYGDNSGSISITATGGTPFAGPNPYNYDWYLNGLSFSTAQSLTNLYPGIYVCHITDANGCLLTEQIEITQPATALTYSVNTTDVTCFGGSNGAIDITVSGGTGAPYSLLWNTGETTEDLANLSAGTYTLTITDAGPCIVTTAPITIIQPTPIVITPSIINVGCHGDASGMITTQVSGGTVNISAGYTYLWSTVNGIIPAGQSTLPNIGSTTHPFGLIPGDYSLLVTDANGCTSSLVATVIQPVAPLYIASTYTNVDCFGDSSGTISVYAEGGTLPYNVSWSGTVAGDPFGFEILSNPGTYIISSLPAGTYNFQVVDQNGCSLAGGAVITQNNLIDTVNTVLNSIFCANSSDGFITTTIIGGVPNALGAPYTIVWSGVDPAGNNIPMLFTSVTGNTTTASNLVAGTYTLTVTDAINCVRTFTYVMTEIVVSLDSVVDNDILCKGQCTGEIEFIPTGGDATYTVSVFPIGQPAANTILITDQDIQANPSGIFSLGGLCPGQYYVLITDANNCSANTPAITITEPSTVFSPSVNVISNSGCNDNAGILNVQVMGGTPGYNVAWHNITDPNITNPAGTEINQSPGNYLITGLSSGLIEVLVTDNVGCEIIDTVEIDDTEVTFANFTAVDSAGCGPFLTQFTNLSLGENLSYFWSFGNGQTSTEVNPWVTFDVGGPYDVTLTVTNAFGCTSTMVQSGYIVAYASPNAAFTIGGSGIDYYSGLVEFINNSVNAQFYTWDFGHFSNGSTEVNPTYYYPQWTEGDYIVTLIATDTNGCSDQAQLLISSSETVRLNVPNTVTIDDNGLNELFFPVFSNFEEIMNFKLEIFNRWGELIFETKDIQGGWNGTYNGVAVQSGTYTWKVTYKDLEGFDYQAAGHINVLR